MTTLLPESSFSQDAPVNSVEHTAVAVPVSRGPNCATEESHEEWQSQLRSLQQLICELLVGNQRLRWALMEVKGLERRDNERRNHKASAATAK
jgi:hypothetical protein